MSEFWREAVIWMAIGAAAVLVGLIHSPYDNGRLFLPWQADTSTPWVLSVAYLAVAGWLWLMAQRQESPGQDITVGRDGRESIR